MSKFLKRIFILILIFIVVIEIIKIFNVKEYILENIYPTTYSEYVYKYSEENDIDPLLTFAIIKAESNFNPDAISNSSAIGLMQLVETTAKEIAEKDLNMSFSKDILYNPEYNIKIGTTYYAKLIKKYNGNMGISLAAYNAGIGKVDGWIKDGIIKEDGSDLENIPYKETNNYVRKILRDYDIYKQIYAKVSKLPKGTGLFGNKYSNIKIANFK